MNRRDFFQRTATATASLAVIATPLSLFVPKPKVTKDEAGVMTIEGDDVFIHGAHIDGGLNIRAKGHVQFVNGVIGSPAPRDGALINLSPPPAIRWR